MRNNVNRKRNASRTHHSIKGVKYISFYGALGYFTAAKRYMLGLRNAGVPFTWTPMIPGRSWGINLEPFAGRAIADRELDPFCNRRIEYDTVIIHTFPDLYPFWIRREPHKRIIGYTVWETDRLPSRWLPHLNAVERVLVPSRWNKSVFERSGVRTPITVVSHIVGEDKAPNKDSMWNVDPEDYVFYTIENWTAGKAIWNTVRCYLDTFTAHDNTLLIIKTSEAFYHESVFTKLGTLKRVYRYVRRLLGVPPHLRIRPGAASFAKAVQKRYRYPARIRVVAGKISEENVHGLHHIADCYVSLCRAEGWGLSPFEAALHGKPIIMTGFGGQLDFLHKDFSFLVDHRMIPVRNDEDKKSFTPNQQWAEPDLSRASRLMREVFENKEAAEVRGRKLRNYVQEHFQEPVVMKTLIRILKQK